MKVINRLRLTLVWAGLVALPVGSSLPVLAASHNEQSATKQKTVQFRITGMTCAACAKGLQASLRNIAGIVKADVDFKAERAVITFDTEKQSADSLSKFVTKCGYQVKEIKVV
jgi:copper chaperone CopZ